MAVEVEIDVELLKSEIKKTYARVSTKPEEDFVFPTGRTWAQDLEYPAELAGVPFGPPGLMWAGYQELDGEMAALGASVRALPPFTDVERDGLEAFLDGVEQRRYSWTWRVADDERFASAVAEIRRFAEERFGPLDRLPREEHEVAWRAYDLPT